MLVHLLTLQNQLKRKDSLWSFEAGNPMDKLPKMYDNDVESCVTWVSFTLICVVLCLQSVFEVGKWFHFLKFKFIEWTVILLNFNVYKNAHQFWVCNFFRTGKGFPGHLVNQQFYWTLRVLWIAFMPQQVSGEICWWCGGKAPDYFLFLFLK